MKDYVIYFLTLVFGVAIFYIFNSIEAQQAMLKMSESKMQIMELMTQILGGVSVFVSFILGFLIVYANNFLIKRRKKEFGLYMLLGMGKGQISRIIVLETLLVGILSLGVGLVIGIFASQLMSILVAKMFEADMSNFQFIFSQDAFIKTMIYFAIIYVFVMLINVFVISKYKLIDLLTASKKTEKIKVRNPIISVILFLISIGILGYAYYLAITEITGVDATPLFIAIGLGCLGTFLFFYSLAGFVLKMVQTSKKLYLKNLNIFVLRQINSKINTTTISMSIICVLLFMTICIFSSAVSLNNSLTTQLKELTPVDVTMYKQVDIKPGTKKMNGKEYTEQEREFSKKSISDMLQHAGFTTKDNFSEEVVSYVYATEQLKDVDSLGEEAEQVKQQYPFFNLNSTLPIVKISEYNEIARLYGKSEYSLQQNEYIIICNQEEIKRFRDKALDNKEEITLGGKTLQPKFEECQNGFISISPQPMETGTIIVPDDVVKEEWKQVEYVNANYKGNTEEEKADIEKKLSSIGEEGGSVSSITYSNLRALTKNGIYDSTKGLSATVIFIGLYLGIIFLISSSAILALKELSEASDNKKRYDVLRKIGADEKMIDKALFKQIGIFYLIPLALAIVHSVFGLKVCSIILSMFGKQDLMGSIIMTAVLIVVVYGTYFLATYFGSKNIIKEE